MEPSYICPLMIAIIAIQVIIAGVMIVGSLIFDYRRKKHETRVARRRARRRALGNAYEAFTCGEMLGCMVVAWLVLAVLWAVTTGVFVL